MVSKSKSNPKQTARSDDTDDDDFQDCCPSLPLTQRPLIINHNTQRPSKMPKLSTINSKNELGLSKSKATPSNSQSTPHSISGGGASATAEISCLMFNPSCQTSKELFHHQPNHLFISETTDCGLESIELAIDCSLAARIPPETDKDVPSGDDDDVTTKTTKLKVLKGGYLSNSIESRLLTSIVNSGPNDGNKIDEDMSKEEDFEHCTQLDVLLKLCSDLGGQSDNFNETDFHYQRGCSDFRDAPVHCPLCSTDISHLTDELRHVHTNECLDKQETPDVVLPNDDTGPQCLGQVLDGSPVRFPHQVADTSRVVEWLRSLGLAKYEDIFVREEIDWDTLQWLTDEDLCSIGVTALGPRRKIVNALSEHRKEGAKAVEIHSDASKVAANDTRKLSGNKLITEFFPGSVPDRGKSVTTTARSSIDKSHSGSGCKQVSVKNPVKNRKLRDIPLWCCIPGTPFRVDAFRYLRGDCSHWFLTHFHMDHYQGLTRSFRHGKIYCSLITARLVNMKIGIPWDKLQVLPLNEKIDIAGTAVTCFDANHCPGSVVILFEPPNGKTVLHTGDFRFSDEMEKMSVFQTCSIQTLILDTTYCNPQYDFPKQEAVIQFVIDSIQAEAFNPKTLFLIGSYTVGKERLFLEVARVLRKKVYVTAAKLRLLECLGLPKEDMQWFTLNEQESHIHVVPMWTLASFKRLKHISTQYASRFSLIVAFSPSGWSFGKGKKKSTGRRWQQGTIIRYEVPYSEHSSYSELREFVKLISPVNIIPSVNNDGPESSNMMVSLLLS